MANNILYVSDGDYGTPAGYMLPLMQGQYGQSVPLEIRDLAGNVVNLTGYTFTATKKKGATVTAWVGSIVLSATPSAAPQVTLTVDQSDTGTDGGYDFFLEGTNGSQVIKTHPVSLTIVKDPAVNATAAPGLVSVTTAQKALLATISGLTGLVKMAAGTATGIAVQAFMETFLGSANAATALTNIGAAAASDLTTHTGLSTTAHGGILPEDAAIVAVSSGRDIATTDAGKILEVTATAALNCPNGLDAGLQCAIASIGGTTTITATGTLQYLDGGVQTAATLTVNTSCTLYHRGSNVWLALGDVSA